jgi:hypothetical protein
MCVVIKLKSMKNYFTQLGNGVIITENGEEYNIIVIHFL